MASGTDEARAFDKSGPLTLDELVSAHRSWLYAHVLRLTGGDHERSEDVLQETFLKAWRYSERLTADQGSVRGWLRRVSHNLVMDGYRAAACRPRETDLDTAPDPPVDDITDPALTGILVRNALARLPIEHREVLLELYFNDRTAVEAARALGIPVGTVKSRAFYAVRRLREVLYTDVPDAA